MSSVVLRGGQCMKSCFQQTSYTSNTHPVLVVTCIQSLFFGLKLGYTLQFVLFEQEYESINRSNSKNLTQRPYTVLHITSYNTEFGNFPRRSCMHTANRARRQSGFPTFIPCQRQDANVLPKRRQSHQGDKLCDVSTVPLVARWPVFLARGSDADGEPQFKLSCHFCLLPFSPPG